MAGAQRFLRIAARVELVSLTVLLLNLVTVHWPGPAAVVGPVHGCAYLAVVLATARHPSSGRRARIVAWVPVIGGLLALRELAAPDAGTDRSPAGAAPTTVGRTVGPPAGNEGVRDG